MAKHQGKRSQMPKFIWVPLREEAPRKGKPGLCYEKKPGTTQARMYVEWRIREGADGLKRRGRR